MQERVLKSLIKSKIIKYMHYAQYMQEGVRYRGFNQGVVIALARCARYADGVDFMRFPASLWATQMSILFWEASPSSAWSRSHHARPLSAISRDSFRNALNLVRRRRSTVKVTGGRSVRIHCWLYTAMTILGSNAHQRERRDDYNNHIVHGHARTSGVRTEGCAMLQRAK
jgi:hypothetical protein